MFNKDVFKNITLGLLVSSSIILCLYIFLGNKLWPSGYNFFIGGNYGFMGRIISVFGQTQPNFSGVTLNEVIKPNRIVITNDSKRAVIEKKDANFSKLTEEFMKILSENPNKLDGKQQDVDDDEWFNTLKYKSVLVDYGEQITTKLWEDVSGVNTTIPELNNIKYIMIAPTDSVLGKLALYYMNSSDGKKYKIKTDIRIEYLEEFIGKNIINAQAAGAYPFSFELNFDGKNKSSNKKFVLKVLIDSHVTINMNDTKVQTFKVTHPLSSTMQDKVEEIVRLFGFRLGAIKRYVEMNNSVLFVENYATLKISSDGLIEYQAIESDKSFKLFEQSKDMPKSKVISESIKNSAGLVQYLNKKLSGRKVELELSDVIENPENKDAYTFCFDYYTNGLPYLIYENNTIVHAVEITIQGGRVQNLKQHIRSFEEDKITTVESIYKAVNKIGKSASDTQINITDAFLAYIDNGSSGLEALWCARLNGEQTIVPMK